MQIKNPKRDDRWIQLEKRKKERVKGRNKKKKMNIDDTLGNNIITYTLNRLTIINITDNYHQRKMGK